MNTSHFIITGTSKGIGEQLAKRLLDDGHFVYGIARGQSEALADNPKYTHYCFDLSKTSDIELLLSKIVDPIKLSGQEEMVGLINNAAMLDPLKRIEQCSAEEIGRNIQISLTAPMVLSSCFIKLTEHLPLRRKIINISSGSGRYPAPAMSVYCTAKAGINMFTQSVGLEQANGPYPVEIIAVDPGMVETAMQQKARGQDERNFEMAKFFQEAHQSGRLQTTEQLAEHLLRIIERRYGTGKLVNYFD